MAGHQPQSDADDLRKRGGELSNELQHESRNDQLALWLAIPQTNLYQIYEANQQLPQVFYRAMEFSADPPILELNSFTRTNLTLLLYGKSGTNYVIEATANLGLTNGWFPATNFTLTNSFYFIGTGNPTNQAMFFRAKRP